MNKSGKNVIIRAKGVSLVFLLSRESEKPRSKQLEMWTECMEDFRHGWNTLLITHFGLLNEHCVGSKIMNQNRRDDKNGSNVSGS